MRKIFPACCASAREAVVRKKVASRRMAVLLFIFPPRLSTVHYSRIDMLIHFIRCRIRRVEREVYGVFDFRGDFVFDALE